MVDTWASSIWKINLRAGPPASTEQRLRTFPAVEFEKRHFIMRPDPDPEVLVAIRTLRE